jgi:hypothetical protein
METLVKNRRFSLAIRVLLVILIIVLASVLIVKVCGIVKVNKAYKISEGVFKETSSATPPRDLGEKDSLVWLAAGGRAAVLEGDSREVLYELSNPFKQPHLSSEQIAKAERLLAANSSAMTMLHRAEGLEAGTNPRVWRSMGGVYALYTTRLLALETRVAIRKGDYSRFFSSARLLTVWVEALQGEPGDAEVEDSSIAIGASCENFLISILKEAAETPGFADNFTAEARNLVPKSDPLRVWRSYLHTLVWLSENGDEKGPVFFEIRPEDENFAERFINNHMFNNYLLASYIEFYSSLANASRKPYSKENTTVPMGYFFPPFKGYKVWEDKFLGRIECVLAQRQLAKAAIEAIVARNSTGKWPDATALKPKDNPWTSSEFVYETPADGSLRISYKGLLELYNYCSPHSQTRVVETWNLRGSPAR